MPILGGDSIVVHTCNEVTGPTVALVGGEQLQLDEAKIRDLLSRTVEVYRHGKELMLWAEECDLEIKSFLQPTVEYKNALDHMMRVVAAMNGVIDGVEADYVYKNLDKVLGHTYRSFFDAADWLAINIREDLFNLLKPYTTSAIAAAIPSYYPEIRPGIDSICEEIASLRNDKDVASEGILSGVLKYRKVVEQLLAWRRTIWQRVPSLDDYRGKERAADRRVWLWRCGIALGAALVGWVLRTLIVG